MQGKQTADQLKYMRKLELLISDEEELRILARKVFDEVFPEIRKIDTIWRILPTQYVTIPLQGTAYLGALEVKQMKRRRFSTTELVGLFLEFIKRREGQLLSQATFTSVVNIQDVPLFSSLELIKVYQLIAASRKALQPYVERQETALGRLTS